VLFVIPWVYVKHPGVALTPLRSFTVTLGWILGKPLTLLFDPFESIVLFLSGETTCFPCNRDVDRLRFWLVLTVNYVVQEGKSNWLKGMILMCAYSPSSCGLRSMTDKCVI
jgi:hypothetical protein